MSGPTKTTIDWLRFRTQAEVPAGLDAMRGMFSNAGPFLNLEALDRGKDGFQRACAVRLANEVIGRVDFGGESQRGWVRWNLSGTGCQRVVDWDALGDVEALPASELRRCDLALTTWRNEVTHERVVEAHSGGGFSCGGRPPALKQILSSDPMAGRTCYVGKRDAAKFFRGYEKGLEVFGKYGDAMGDPPLLEGFPVQDVYRCEVELKTLDIDVPWEAIERRDQYFAGCYPFLADLLPGVEADILQRRPDRMPQLELKQALANVRTQYGATIFTALAAYGGDMCRVWDAIVGREHNKALLAAGVLEVEHE
jgi:DNA relaxase NicK